MSEDKRKTRRQILQGAVAAAAGGVGGYALYTQLTGSRTKAQHPYNLSKYRHVDPALIRYAEQPGASFAVDLKAPRAICCDGDSLLIGGDRRVLEAANDGTVEKYWTANDDVHAIVTGAGGTRLIALRRGVAVIDGERLTPLADLGKRAVLTSLAAGPDRIFVADAGNRVVHCLDRSGKRVGEIGRDGGKLRKSRFVVPSPYFTVAVGVDGDLRIANPGRHRVETWTPDGRFVRAWGDHGLAVREFCGCCNPVDFAPLPGGNMVTVEKGLTRIKEYSPAGEFACVVAAPQAFADHDAACARRGGDCRTGGLSVAVDADRRVWLLNPYSGQVRVFRRNDSSQEASDA